jgi:hypothetical protein
MGFFLTWLSHFLEGLHSPSYLVSQEIFYSPSTPPTLETQSPQSAKTQIVVMAQVALNSGTPVPAWFFEGVEYLDTSQSSLKVNTFNQDVAFLVELMGSKHYTVLSSGTRIPEWFQTVSVEWDSFKFTPEQVKEATAFLTEVQLIQNALVGMVPLEDWFLVKCLPNHGVPMHNWELLFQEHQIPAFENPPLKHLFYRGLELKPFMLVNNINFSDPYSMLR